MDAGLILKFVEEMELIDDLEIQVYEKNTFWKQAVTNDRLVMDDVIILTLVKEMEFIDTFV